MAREVPRRLTHTREKPTDPRKFDYSLNYKKLNLRKTPELYRVGRSEQGVLLVEPYKSEILPDWRFKTPELARESAAKILKRFRRYRDNEDFVGMDMARKFLQMGFTRSRRYANHKSGRKYSKDLQHVLKFENDAEKAESANIFWSAWHEAEDDDIYVMMKQLWREAFG